MDFSIAKGPQVRSHWLVLDAAPEETIEVSIYDMRDNLLYTKSATVQSITTRFII